MKSILITLLCGFPLMVTSFAAAAEPKEADKSLPAKCGLFRSR